MKTIKEILESTKGNINSEEGVELEVPKGAEVLSISIDSPKGWSDECYFYKLEHLLSAMGGSSKEEEMKKALSKVGGTYMNVQGKSKTMLVRFK